MRIRTLVVGGDRPLFGEGMTRSRFIAIVLSSILVCFLVGCSRQDDGPAILPADDPLCGVFPNATVAAMLPGGTYDYLIKYSTSRITYLETFVATNGDCTLNQMDGLPVGVSVYAAEDDHSRELVKTCYDAHLTSLVVPRVGQIIDSGSCVKTDKYPRGEAWVLYWGGRNGFDGPEPSLIDADIFTRDGRDPVEDATTLVQMVFDFIDRSYAADSSSALPPANGPSTQTPVPSVAPSAQESGG